MHSFLSMRKRIRQQITTTVPFPFVSMTLKEGRFKLNKTGAYTGASIVGDAGESVIFELPFFNGSCEIASKTFTTYSTDNS